MDLCYPTMGFNRVFTFLLLYSSLFGGISGGIIDNKPGNCREAYDLGSTATGETNLYTASGKQFKMYCHFGTDNMYGLLHKDTFEKTGIDLDVTKLYDHMDHALIVFYGKDDKWYHVRAGRLDHRSSTKRPVIMWNSHHGFTAPRKININYLYLGFYDQQESKSGSVQGIHIINNEKDCSYTRSGTGTKSYIAFYGQQGSIGSLNYHPNNLIFTCFLDEVRPIAINAPEEYTLFGIFEFGGGGAHFTTDKMTDYDGMNFIFPYHFDTCCDPEKHKYTERSGDIFTKGSTVNYTCVEGTKYSSGDWSITCMGKPGWSGQPLVCKPSSNCREAYDLGSTKSGEKILSTASGKEFKFYCHFGDDKIYGLLHKDVFKNSDIDLDTTKLYDHMDGSMIVFFDTSLSMNQVMVGRLDHTDRPDKRPVIMWNKHTGFKAPATTDMNYLFLGFYDEEEAAQENVDQGIHVISKNKDCKYTKCDKTADSSIAFYGVKGTVQSAENPGNMKSCLLDAAVSIPIDAPMANYKLFGDIHFGGCGCHVTSDELGGYWNGMTFIFTLPYRPCEDPGQLINTVRSGDNFAKGSTVNYTCVAGSEHTSGDLSRTCMGYTGWSGQPLVCTHPSKYAVQHFNRNCL